jgi:alkaline phosphatase D
MSRVVIFAVRSMVFAVLVAAMTLPSQAQETLSRIAFGSCAKQWEPQPIWNAIAAQQPDIFLFLGDAIYGDWHGREVFTPTVESLSKDWSQLANIPEFDTFREKVPILATWDNHDFGKHDGGAEFTLKKKSKKLFLDFFGEPSDSERRARDGIYDARIYGPDGKRVQVILLDTRTFKSPYIKDERSKEEKSALGIRGQYLPNIDPDATLLGEAQWAWLEQQLQKPADIRLVASSTQIVADEKAMEEWRNFPLERQRLFELIKKTNAAGVVLLSGNVHYSEISKSDEGPYALYDFTSSGMTHTTPGYSALKNGKRFAGPYTDFNFGLVEIDWENTSGPIINLIAYGADGDAVFRTDVELESLKR